MIYQQYDLNMIPDTMVLPVVHVSQFDNNGRTIVFSLKNGNENYTPTNVKVNIDGNDIEAEIYGNKVSFAVTRTLTEYAGMFAGEVVDTNDGIIGSCNFRFRVDQTPYTGGGDEPEPEPEDLTEYNQALSIILGRTVNVPNPKTALSILQGE